MTAFRKAHPPVGARPGTLVIPPDAPRPRIHVFEYSPAGAAEHDVTDPNALRACLAGERTCWIDVQGLGDEAMLRTIATIFALHPLTLEDAVNVPQRAKAELYERLRVGVGPIWSEGPDYLAYALIDTLVDRYYPIAQALSERLEDLEDEPVDETASDTLRDIHCIRHELVVLRRVGWPQREAIHALLREHSPFMTEPVRLHLRDTADHISQIMELIDSTREMAVGLSELYLSNVSQRTSEVMKVLTLMASIFIPLTFIAGIYGMNFENMPELKRPWAYFAVLGVMAAAALGMIAYFWRRGWIASGRRRSRGGA
jgi:magnesium transporter